ncbi:MAG: class I mannose-6-phosphate isomerase [Acidimicrobiia bacterium]|nr:class I mannose-6-phosphate isomerase [Acidimicrobiia bacterium]
MNTTLRPFTLDPVLVQKPWGGRRLTQYGKHLPEGVKIGESWEVADLPDNVASDTDDPRSRVSSGPLAGMSLQEVIAAAGDDLLGPVPPTSEGRFPLLVKLLDAREHLSVQVHPHEGYVANHPGTRLKTESWYVVDADPGSVIFHGLASDSDLVSVREAIGTPAIVPHLRTVEAVPGSFHHVPSGLVHSLGAGVMVAEVQTPSDTTFRLYDWTDEYGRAPRQMHQEQGAAALVVHPEGADSLAPWSQLGVREAISNRHYWIREHRHDEGGFELSSLPGPRVLMVISGTVAVTDLVLEEGSTGLVPACAIDTVVEVDSAAVYLEIGLGV